MRIKYKMKETFDRAEVEAYHKGRLVGFIVATPIEDVCQIEFFYVTDYLRRQGMGAHLMANLVHLTEVRGIKEIIVYPLPQADELPFSSLSVEELYTVYEHLGFVFAKPCEDRTMPEQEMIKRVSVAKNE